MGLAQKQIEPAHVAPITVNWKKFFYQSQEDLAMRSLELYQAQYRLKWWRKRCLHSECVLFGVIALEIIVSIAWLVWGQA